MERLRPKRQWSLLITTSLILHLFISVSSILGANARDNGVPASPPVHLQQVDNGHVSLDNGLVKITLSTPQGLITSIEYGGIPNLLLLGKEDNRGYWDIVWGPPGSKLPLQDKLSGTTYRVIREDENQVELSFSSGWDSKSGAGPPLNVDKRFIMTRGSSGFYSYAIFERLAGWPSLNLAQSRVAFKLSPKLFDYMAVSDTRQRFMPTESDRVSGQRLGFNEAVRLTNPGNLEFKGEVDDKYQYSADIKDNKVHGWIASNPTVGFWVITPSNEFRMGGPLKQELTSHVGPTSLAVFFSGHYAGTAMTFEKGETWKKVFGPVFIYLNYASPKDADPRKTLWEDAKLQMDKETKSWPYEFPMSEDYPHANQRGSVSGQLQVCDRYLDDKLIVGSFAYVGLANPGDVRSWQYESKGYQFWTQADKAGNFVINNIRPGSYNLYAWVPGVIGDYKYDITINVNQGSDIRLGSLIYSPLRSGPTIWEIGIPDRTAAEFYVPDPNPSYINRALLNSPENKFRQYGLWERYTELYPRNDLVYTVGTSDYRKDWFFAQVTRRFTDNVSGPTTWTVLFDLKAVTPGTYTLQVALASASMTAFEVRVNDPHTNRPNIRTMRIGRDNAIARHGIHGLYMLYSLQIPSSQILPGRNAIFLTQARNGSFTGFMYDYIRLEGPPLP